MTSSDGPLGRAPAAIVVEPPACKPESSSTRRRICSGCNTAFTRPPGDGPNDALLSVCIYETAPASCLKPKLEPAPGIESPVTESKRVTRSDSRRRPSARPCIIPTSARTSSLFSRCNTSDTKVRTPCSEAVTLRTVTETC